MDKKGQGWKSELIHLLSTKGRVAARARGGKTKPVSNRTQDAREQCLFLCMNQLEGMGYKLRTLSRLKEKHVQALASRWETEGISAATLQNRLSHLRTLASWLGKKGMVGPSERYVTDPSRVKRTSVATYDHSWSAAGVDADRLIGMVSAFDKYVGLQLRLCHAFYLRKEEAVMFRPFVADRGDHLVVRDGTKGGRERVVQIESDYQRTVLEQAKRLARTPRGHVGHPDRDLKQALNRFAYVVRKFGVSKDGLGITAHGLRHQGLNDLYERVSGGVPSPVRQAESAGPGTMLQGDPARELQARYRVSQEGGHARLSISGAYLGSHSRKGMTHSPAVQTMLKRWSRYFQLLGKGQSMTEDERREMLGLRALLHEKGRDVAVRAMGIEDQKAESGGQDIASGLEQQD